MNNDGFLVNVQRAFIERLASSADAPIQSCERQNRLSNLVNTDLITERFSINTEKLFIRTSRKNKLLLKFDFFYFALVSAGIQHSSFIRVLHKDPLKDAPIPTHASLVRMNGKQFYASACLAACALRKLASSLQRVNGGSNLVGAKTALRFVQIYTLAYPAVWNFVSRSAFLLSRFRLRRETDRFCVECFSEKKDR